MAKKILVIVESLLVDRSSGAKANHALVSNLEKAGFELKVYHYSGEKILCQSYPLIEIPENRKSLLFYLSRMERILRYNFKIYLNKFIDRSFGFSFTLFNDKNSIATLLKKENWDFDFVLTLSQGGSFRPHHALLQFPEWYKKWIAYIHDPYPMAAFPRPYDWVEPGHQIKRKFFLKVAERAEFMAYPSELLAEWMESYYPPLKNKTRLIIPHQLVKEPEEPGKLPPFFDPEKFSVVHAGTLLNARNPWGLVKGFQKFLERVPQAQLESQLVFIGGPSRNGKELLKFKKEMEQLKVTEAPLPFKTALDIQRKASVNVILEAKGPISPFLPGKFPHCIGAGKPILLLGPFYSESKRLLGVKYEFWSEIDDVDQICQLLIRLFNSWRNGEAVINFSELENYLSEPHLKETLNSIA